MENTKEPNIGAFIKAIRVAKGLTADDIAKACNVNRSTVFRWENGDTSRIKYPCILARAKLLDIPPESLFGYWHFDIEEELSLKDRRKEITEDIAGRSKQELVAVYGLIKSIKGEEK